MLKEVFYLLAVVLIQVVSDLLGGPKHLQELGQLIVLQASSQLRLQTRKNLIVLYLLYLSCPFCPIIYLPRDVYG